MKVKISYTIDDSEIPNELAKFLEKAAEELSQRANEIRQISNTILNGYNLENLAQYYEDINQVRTKTIKADTIMSDCQDILVGMHQINEQQKQEALAEPVEQQVADTPPVAPPQTPQEGVNE